MNPLLLEKLNAHPELLPDQADQQYTITGSAGRLTKHCSLTWETISPDCGFTI
jgi:hypothetical protein